MTPSREAPCYTISVLGTAHQEVSSQLARPGEHQLDGIGLLPTSFGPAPRSPIRLWCSNAHARRSMTGAIIRSWSDGYCVLRVARPERLWFFFRGKYGALSPRFPT